jgi:hypothetical protein
MALHFEPTAEVQRRVVRRRVISGICGMALAVAFIAALGFSLDGMLAEPEPVYRPQIVLYATEVETTCDGWIVCPARYQILRKPTPPASFGLRQLGLAPPKAPESPVPLSGELPYRELNDGTWD